MQLAEQLRILSIFHYVVGGLHALLGSFGLIHLSMGIWMASSPNTWGPGPSGPPAFFPWIFIVAGGLVVLLGWTVGVLTAMSGMFISHRVHRTFSIVIGCVNCALFPIGTTLGVFDLILLTKDETRQEYEKVRLATATNAE